MGAGTGFFGAMESLQISAPWEWIAEMQLPSTMWGRLLAQPAAQEWHFSQLSGGTECSPTSELLPVTHAVSRMTLIRRVRSWANRGIAKASSLGMRGYGRTAVPRST